ncbi:MAG: vWA domain-containing protein, partial [Candidatus Kapaibacteriota bacterium]
PNQLFNLSNWTGFRMNGNPISNDTSFDPINHQYQIEVSGQDKELTFAIIDSVYSFADSILKEDYANNSGEVNVLIEEVIPYFVNICSATPQLDPNDPTKMTGIKVDVSVLVQSSGNKNILFDKNQVAIYDNGNFVCPDTIICNKTAESVSIAMLFDRSGSMTDRVSKVDSSIRIDSAVSSAKNFVNKLTPDDSVLLMSFSDSSDIDVDVNWTLDKTRIRNSIDGFANNLNFTILQTALHKALIAAISRTKTHSNRIKAIVTLTDGANNVAPFDEQVVINILPASRNIPIYIIALGMDTEWDTTLAGQPRLIDSIRAENNRVGLIKMQNIADASRGKLIRVTNSVALDSIYTMISRDIRQQECCSIEYPVNPCKEGTGDTVRRIDIFYPFKGGVAARSTSYRTNCATLLMGENQSDEAVYSKVNSPNSQVKKTSSSFELNLPKKSTIQVELFDEKGNKVNTVLIKNLRKGSNTVTLSTNGLPVGSYSAKVNANGKMISQHEITIQE